MKQPILWQPGLSVVTVNYRLFARDIEKHEVKRVTAASIYLENGERYMLSTRVRYGDGGEGFCRRVEVYVPEEHDKFFDKIKAAELESEILHMLRKGEFNVKALEEAKKALNNGRIAERGRGGSK